VPDLLRPIQGIYMCVDFFPKKLPPYTPVGFDLTTHSSKIKLTGRFSYVHIAIYSKSTDFLRDSVHGLIVK
jgi:hypothetical protein